MARTGPGASGPEALRRRAIRLEYFTVGWNIVEAAVALAARGLETLLCSYLSATLLAGLALNGLFGWWWADPVAGLAIPTFMVREAIKTLREETYQA
jgi:divalent metal cation (Fe/Co/Zn/Cd) transporter